MFRSELLPSQCRTRVFSKHMPAVHWVEMKGPNHGWQGGGGHSQKMFLEFRVPDPKYFYKHFSRIFGLNFWVSIPIQRSENISGYDTACKFV